MITSPVADVALMCEPMAMAVSSAVDIGVVLTTVWNGVVVMARVLEEVVPLLSRAVTFKVMGVLLEYPVAGVKVRVANSAAVIV